MALNIGGNNGALSLQTQRNLLQAGNAKKSLMKNLSSGLRINTGADDPSGLAISEMLRSQLSGYSRALQNTQETNNVMSIAEGGLSSVSSMLTQMRGLAIQALNTGVTSGAQTQANQAQLNSALQTINRVVTTTSYAGQNLLNGARDFTFQTNDPGNMLAAGGQSITNMSGTASRQVTVDYAGNGAAAQAERAYVSADFGGTAVGTAQEFTVTGQNGSRTFAFAQGTTVEEMAAQINQSAASTGVNAYAVGGQTDAEGNIISGTQTQLRLVSAEYGSSANVRVDQITGNSFAEQGRNVVDYGQDAQIQVNGQTVQTNGLTANVANSHLNARLTLNADAIGQTGYDRNELVNATNANQARLTNIQGGMQLQLGEGAGGQNRDNISLGNYNPAVLGQVSYNGQTYSMNDLYGGGRASLANNPEAALAVIDQAIADVASGRATIGAYQANTLDTNANNLMAAIESTTATESGIRDTDIAAAITQYMNNQLREEASMRMLRLQSQNMQSNNVTRLLGTL